MMNINNLYSDSSRNFSESNFFAEVVESNLQCFTAQCWEWNVLPEFGSLVQVDSKQFLILGCITQVQTGSIDPMRHPYPYKKTEEELLIEQPQIFEFLRTIFSVQVVGYLNKQQNKIFYVLPPIPCKIHTFVKECTKELISNFFKEPLYLHVLFSFFNQNINLDELLLAILRKLANQGALNQEMLDEFCQTFSLLTGNDYRRLKLFLKRVEKIIG